MTTQNLTPAPILDFFINGIPANGGQLFTYLAGTTTKAAVFTDSSGVTQFTNPIIMNARGEPQNIAGSSTGIWLAPGTYYKFVFAPSTDTDPPAHPIWTVDNVGSPGLGLSTLTPSGGNDGPILAALSGPVILTGGTFLIQSNTTVTQPLFVTPGTKIRPSTGVTLTITAPFNAAAVPLFTNALSGQGSVVFSSSAIDQGYAEWWGAVTGAPLTDCGPPIAASCAACPVTQLFTGAYYCQNTITIATNGRTLRGMGHTQACAATGAVGGPGSGVIDPNATQIVLTSPTNIGIVVGTLQSTEPANLVVNVRLEKFTLVRATAAFPLGVTGASAINNPASGTGLFGANPLPVGIAYVWIGLCYTTDVICIEHSVGLYLYGCVASYWFRVSGLRYTPGQHAGNDNFSGFYLDYSAPFAGYNGGNASIYLDYCRGFANVPTQSYTYASGITTFGGFVDLFIFRFESGLIQYGMDFQGDGGAAPFKTEDLHVTGCVCDSATLVTMRIQNGGTYENVNIVGGYFNAVNGTCIYLNNLGGMVSITGVGAIDATTSTGLSVNNINQVICVGNTWDNFTQPIIVNACAYSEFRDVIHKISLPGTALPAVSLTNVQNSLVACAIGGPVGSYTSYVSMDNTSSAKNDIYCTKAQRSTIGGAANLILYGGVAWGGGATFGTHIATGIIT